MACGIYGVYGPEYDPRILESIRDHAQDRGRDGGRQERFEYGVVGLWRAAPTTERFRTDLGPYDGIAHNGTIANDAELGVRPGEIDSMVLPRILDRSSLAAFQQSLLQIKGSYAIAAYSREQRSVFLACNYKPLYYWSPTKWDTISRTPALSGRPVYFASMARHFGGVLPFGQAPVKLEPYSVLDLASGLPLWLPRQRRRRALVIASAGLDSTTVASMLLADGYEVCLLHFRYGCKAEEDEAKRIPRIARALGATYQYLDLDYRALGASSALLDGAEDAVAPMARQSIAPGIEGAEYAKEWVPARNLLMLAHAVAYAESNAYHHIALGNNLEEAGAYPDNEEEMTILFSGLLSNAVHDGYALDIQSPVGHLMKHEIVAKGLALGTPYHLTWSCYKPAGPDGAPCHDCGPCFMREEAFRRNGEVDPLAGRAART